MPQDSEFAVSNPPFGWRTSAATATEMLQVEAGEAFEDRVQRGQTRFFGSLPAWASIVATKALVGVWGFARRRFDLLVLIPENGRYLPSLDNGTYTSVRDVAAGRVRGLRGLLDGEHGKEIPAFNVPFDVIILRDRRLGFADRAHRLRLDSGALEHGPTCSVMQRGLAVTGAGGVSTC